MLDKNRLLRLGVAMLTCAVSACGGGGASPTPSPPPPPPPSAPLVVTASGSSYTFLGLAPGTAAPQSLQFTLTGGTGGYFVGATSDSGDFPVTYDILSGNTVAMTVQPSLPPGQGAHRVGHVTFLVCSDAQCQQVAWKKDYAYDYTQFAVDQTPLVLTGTEGVVNAPVVVTVTPPDVNHVLVAQQGAPASTSPPAASWLSADHDVDGNLTLTASGVGLGAGSFSSTLSVALAQNPSVSTAVPVSFTIGNGIVAPGLPGMVLEQTSTAASMVGSAPLAFNGGLSPAWTAQSDQPWLVLDTPSGVGPATLRYHVDLSASAAAVPNWTTSSANVTISSPGLNDAHAALSLQHAMPEITMLTPSQVTPNQIATLTLSGRGLSQLTSIGQILVAGQPVASGTIVSDTQAIVHLPASPAGSLQVSVSNASGLSSAQANIAVQGGVTAGAAVSNPANSTPDATVYDPSRQAVFVADYYGGVLQRFKLQNGTWTLTGTPWNGVWRVQMSPDRRTLYVLDTNALSEVDPDSLAVIGTYPSAGLSAGFTYSVPMPLTADLRLWLPEGSGQYFDMRTRQFARLPVESGFAGASQGLTGTPDGQHVFAPSGWFDVASQTTTALPSTPFSYFYSASFDAQGKVGFFFGNAVYRTSDWKLLGNAIPASPEYGFNNDQVSPDGRRVYKLVTSSTFAYSSPDHVEVFDTTQLQAGTSNLALLGSIPLPTSATACTEQDLNCYSGGIFSIDPLGTTLFWVGNKAFVAVPIPTNLRGQVAATQAGLGRVNAEALRTRAH